MLEEKVDLWLLVEYPTQQCLGGTSRYDAKLVNGKYEVAASINSEFVQ